jgi:uncharacterized integral membrane protein
MSGPAASAGSPPANTRRRPARRKKTDAPPARPATVQVDPSAIKADPPPAKADPPPVKTEPRRVQADPPAIKDTGRGKDGAKDSGAEPGVDQALAASQSDLAKLQAARRRRLIKAVVLTAIALVFIVFILQNANPVDMRVLAWTVSVRLIWIIVASALLGALAGYLVGRPDKNLLLHGPSRREEDPR